MKDTESIVLKSNSELIQYLINELEVKDSYTQGHSHHVCVIVKAIFDCLPTAYQNKIDRENLLTAALLHDIGKIITPDYVLNKEGELNKEEWRIMRHHTLNGKKIIENTVFADTGEWILYHHEQIDGGGYYGLKGEKISLESRIIAIADAFSALRTYRVYRSAKNLMETISIIRENAGTQFDSEILSHFFAVETGILETLECNCEICRQRREALRETGWRVMIREDGFCQIELKSRIFKDLDIGKVELTSADKIYYNILDISKGCGCILLFFNLCLILILIQGEENL